MLIFLQYVSIQACKNASDEVVLLRLFQLRPSIFQDLVMHAFIYIACTCQYPIFTLTKPQEGRQKSSLASYCSSYKLYVMQASHSPISHHFAEDALQQFRLCIGLLLHSVFTPCKLMYIRVIYHQLLSLKYIPVFHVPFLMLFCLTEIFQHCKSKAAL